MKRLCLYAAILLAIVVLRFGCFPDRATIQVVVPETWADYGRWLAEDYCATYSCASESIDIHVMPYEDLQTLVSNGPGKHKFNLALVDAPWLGQSLQATPIGQVSGEWSAYLGDLCDECKEAIVTNKENLKKALPVLGNAAARCTRTGDTGALHVRVGTDNALVTDFLTIIGEQCTGKPDMTCVGKALKEFDSAAEKPSLAQQAFDERQVADKLESGEIGSGFVWTQFRLRIPLEENLQCFDIPGSPLGIWSLAFFERTGAAEKTNALARKLIGHAIGLDVQRRMLQGIHCCQPGGTKPAAGVSPEIEKNPALRAFGLGGFPPARLKAYPNGDAVLDCYKKSLQYSVRRYRTKVQYWSKLEAELADILRKRLAQPRLRCKQGVEAPPDPKPIMGWMEKSQ